MAAILECRGLCKEYGDRMVLKDICLEIIEGECLGVVGDNGAGKSTLINILIGKLEATGGKVIWHKKALQIGYMPQATEYINRTTTLSGGERTKEVLTQILYSKNDLLVLDEPTNHLDNEGIKWLIKQLKKFRGTVVLISHDRYFLDQCATRIVEINDGMAKSYKGNYSAYREEKQRQFDSQLKLYLEQEKVKEQIEGQIHSLKNWSDKAHRESAKKAIATGNKFGGKEYNRVKAKKKDKAIKSRIKRLEKINVEGIARPKEEISISFQLASAEKTGSVIVTAKNIGKTYSHKTLFKRSSFYIKRGEHIGLYGVNGCGKSTLIKGLLGEVEIEGELKIKEGIRLGYISQDVVDLDEEKSVIELFDVATKSEYAQIITALSQMGFQIGQLSKKVGTFSLGERMKIKLLLMIQEGCELLILDEPTNHVDLHVRQQLEEALKQYTGTIILITHDRYMLKEICDKLLVFEHQDIRRYEYGINDYLERREKQKVVKQLTKPKDTLILENKLAYIIGKLSKETPGTEAYQELDKAYRELLKEKMDSRI